MTTAPVACARLSLVVNSGSRSRWMDPPYIDQLNGRVDQRRRCLSGSSPVSRSRLGFIRCRSSSQEPDDLPPTVGFPTPEQDEPTLNARPSLLHGDVAPRRMIPRRVKSGGQLGEVTLYRVPSDDSLHIVQQLVSVPPRSPSSAVRPSRHALSRASIASLNAGSDADFVATILGRA
jgi:hypothetical protein